MKTILRLLIAVPLALASASAQDWAVDKLAKSSRHQEWVKIKSGEREVSAFVVYPEIKEKAKSVLVIHEIFGLTDWVRGVADQLAEAGYIAIAPDLLSGMAPGGGGTKELAKENAVGTVIRDLPPDQITADLNAVADYVIKAPSADGTLAVCGFCWGGSQTFRYAANRKDLTGAFVFYGTAPTEESVIARIQSPVYGFYGANDNRVNSTIAKTEELMKAAGKKYEPVIYDEAGHGFMRSGEEPGAKAPNRAARDAAWERWKNLLK